MNNAKETVEILKKVPLFSGLTNRQLNTLASSFVARSFSDGEEVVKQGESGVGIFIIVSGEAEAVREVADGEQVSVNRFGATDFFGELALLSEGTRTASVYARSELKCLVLPRWDFIAHLKEDAEMAVSVAQELASRFRDALDTVL